MLCISDAQLILLESKQNIDELSPLIIKYEAGKFYCILQKDDFMLLKQQRIDVYPAIIVLKGNMNYKLFMKKFGNVYCYIDKE